MKIFSFKNKNLKGFTLIELLVATSLFAIIAISGVSVLLSAQRTYKRLSNNRVVIDNVNLVLSNISREIKFGTDYNCINPASANSDFKHNTNNYYSSFPISLPSGSNTFCNAIAFTPQGATTSKIVYYYNSASSSINEADYDSNGGGSYGLVKDIPMNSSDFNISNFSLNMSGVGKIGNNPGDDFLQPKVNILISGIIPLGKDNLGKDSVSTFSVQDTVSQRVLDN
ncbi:MAG: type II secretion system protein [Candidatus Nomurabacteria bacterium]